MMNRTKIKLGLIVLVVLLNFSCSQQVEESMRERISLNEHWKFYRYPTLAESDGLIYDVRPEVEDFKDDKPADSKPTEAEFVSAEGLVLKPWILPSGNKFIKDVSKHHQRPEGNPGADFPFVQADFNDADWQSVELPHDWSISADFYTGWDVPIGGGMGRLPSHGVAWYRRNVELSPADKGKSIYLDVDGAMAYAMVWLNGSLVGGWPYGYNSFRLDLTPYVNYSGTNQLAIRLDNPPASSRWYTGGGIYRNVWLVKTQSVHVAHWGTTITTPDVSVDNARVNLEILIDNDSKEEVQLKTETSFYALGKDNQRTLVALEESVEQVLKAQQQGVLVELNAFIENPKLWSTHTPNMHLAITRVFANGELVDCYETKFGIRSLEFSPTDGLLVNGESVRIQGVNQHHDLGALGAAFNTRAAERQLEILKGIGCNAIRMAHNPPAPELLALTDSMGFLVINEVFDSWERKKTPLDFHLIFPEWKEQDLRSFMRRDKNHPSVIAWSFGNEVGEQYTEEAGANLAAELQAIVHDEDPTRPATASMNFAKPYMPFSAQMDLISLNYQGEGIRNAGAYHGLKGINTEPLYPAFHDKYPSKQIVSSESASALSTRGTYVFPVYEGESAPVRDGFGGDSQNQWVSAYEQHSADFGSSADKVFRAQDENRYVAGEFVWSGFDYLGEPTPYYLARSSYCGIIDLAGFPKDRYYLYQSRWRPDLPMIHILPHWNWAGRDGEITPVHVFTSGDEAELFLNGQSQGRKKKGEFEYRLRWDEIRYEPGELKVIAYKNGSLWAEASLKTTGKPAKLHATADSYQIAADGKDLAFITVRVLDERGEFIRNADNLLHFSIEGEGEIVATDNGDPSDMVGFSSKERNAFSGMALCVVRGKKLEGEVVLSVQSEGLEKTQVIIKVQ
ncbi:MAG: beta-galactosidase GalB [Mangrovibacterium sp.]